MVERKGYKGDSMAAQLAQLGPGYSQRDRIISILAHVVTTPVPLPHSRSLTRTFRYACEPQQQPTACLPPLRLPS